MNLLTFLKTNFLHVAPILLLGIAGMVIIIERAYALFVTYSMNSRAAFMEKISDLVMKAKISDAISVCDQTGNKPVAKIVKSALARAHLPEGLISDGVMLAVQNSTRALMKRTAFLATIANVATLLGLFGTIAGLIQSFEAVGHADAQQKAALLSAGIATAMNATMLGLGVAIPCMIAFSFLSNRTNHLISEYEESAVQITDVLKQRFYAGRYRFCWPSTDVR